MNENLLTEDQAADELGISPRTLQAWRYAATGEKGPCHVKIGRSVRYRKADIEAWIAERVVQ